MDKALPDAGANEEKAEVKGTSRAMKVAISSALGYSFETYDLTVFLFASTIMAPSFFPAASYQASLLLAFLAFALAFIARPLGGLVFGHFGDRRGRKGPWFVTLIGMGGATLLIGFLPTYAQIGSLATALLIILRLSQGFFLAGEQSAGWTFTEEVSPPRLRGLFGGVVNMGTGLAQVFLAVSIIVASDLAPGPAFAVLGWRILFWLGALPAVIAFIVRWRIDESPEWRQKVTRSIERIPIVTVFRKNLKFFAIVCLASLGGALLAYGSIIYIPSFLKIYTSLSTGQIAEVVLAINLSYIAGAPIGGYVSDRLRSRKKYLIVIYILDGIIVLPTLAVLISGNIGAMIVVGGVFGFLNSFFLSTIPAWVSENISGNVRFSFIAVAGNIGPALGVLAPFIITEFAQTSGPVAAASLVTAVGGVIAATSIAFSPRDRVAQPLQ